MQSFQGGGNLSSGMVKPVTLCVLVQRNAFYPVAGQSWGMPAEEGMSSADQEGSGIVPGAY